MICNNSLIKSLLSRDSELQPTKKRYPAGKSGGQRTVISKEAPADPEIVQNMR